MPQFHRSRALCRKGIATQATWHWADSSKWGKMGSDDQQDHVNATTSGENNHESDTNSFIRRTRGSGASGNAASRTRCERSPHQGSRRLGQSVRLESAGRLREGIFPPHLSGNARLCENFLITDETSTPHVRL